MRKSFLLSVFCLTQIFLLPGIQDSAVQASGQMARRIPADSYFYLTMPDIKNLVEQWKKRSVLQMLDEPAFADFNQKLKTNYEKASREIEQKTGYSLATIWDVPSGEVSISAFNTSDDHIGSVALMEYGAGESSVVLKKLLGLAADEMTNGGASRSIKSVRGTIFRIYSFEETRQTPDSSPFARKVAYFLKDNTLVISNDDKLLESILTNWEGRKGDSLADNKEFQYIFNKCAQKDAAASTHWYLNPVGTIQSTLDIYKKSEPMAGMAQGVLPSLGISNLKAVGGSAYFFTRDYEFISKTFTYVKLPGYGLIEIFRCPAVAQQPPWWVSNQCSSYYSFNWAIDDAYQAVESLHDGFRVNPGALAQAIDDYSKQEDSPKIHLKKDILDNLTGRIQIIATQQGEEIAEQLLGRYTVAVGLKNPEAFQKIMHALLEWNDSKIATREFQGTTLYEYPEGLIPAAFCITDNTLIASTNVKALEKIIRNDRQTDSLVDDPNYKKISQIFPTKTSIISYQRLDTSILAITQLFQKNKDSVDIDEDILSQFQDLEGVIKYLPITAGYTVPDDHGFFSVRVTMKKTAE
ncbi:hypothetical protein Pan241w_30120 [Gimesia alba]|uniref:DUF3352 domain-containing protein n=1 Tax=Gimesia alba TaxID=2527973 RepID=A0A517RGB5_9PLAN|nr:DUF3352 domain-containing protein [Gimesia alba]QDT42917.1 hypothetical protein Pan241w_30120 [Gimesia alba]